MQNSTFAPRNQNEFDNNKLQKFCDGVGGSCALGSTLTLDYTLTDDVLLVGGHVLLVRNASWGDYATFQIVSPAGQVIMTFINKWYIDPSFVRQQIATSNYPAKVPAGAKLRIVYTSVGTLPALGPDVAINYNFEKVTA